VIDGAADTVIAQVSTGDVAVCYNSVNNKVYGVTLGGVLTVFDGAGDTVLTRDTVGSGSQSLCYNPRDNKVYTANFNSGSVSVVDGATDSVIATVPVANGAWVVAYDSSVNWVYCADNAHSTVTVIDGSSNQVVTTINTGRGPRDFALNPTQHRVYTANDAGSSISVIRTAAGVEDAAAAEARSAGCRTSIVQGRLNLRSPTVLLDAAGRKATALRPGSNDVSFLAPGVYFACSSGRVGKVVVLK
jgi:YVTN family beta-propeller protein